MSGSCNCGMLIDAYNLTTELIKATTQDEHNTRKRQSEIKPVAQPEQTGTPQVLENVPQRTAGVEGPAVVAKINMNLESMALRQRRQDSNRQTDKEHDYGEGLTANE